MSGIELSGVTKRFGSATAVWEASLSVPSRAFFALLGPSGCGKTTLLRLIAGLERPDEGRIAIGGRLVAGPGLFTPPQERELGMVFQSYALWPHMTVAGNVAFGLGLRRMTRAAREAKVAEALALVGLAELAGRRPHELSGGQRQRVALARSLAVDPAIILLDEPLANLDAHLRGVMLAEFRRIHREARTTFVLVTHDQSEAMALADLVAVMDRGRVEQVAPPAELWARPATPMVARFVGGGRMVPVQVVAPGLAPGTCRVRVQGHNFEVPGDAATGPGWLCLRPRDLSLGRVQERDGVYPRLAGLVVDRRFEAGDHVLTLALDSLPAEVALEARSADPLPLGAPVAVALRGGWVLPRAA